MSKIFKIMLGVLVAIVIFIGTVLYLALSSGNYKTDYKETFEATKKIREAEKNGATVEFSINDINELAGTYFKKGRSKGQITINGMNVQINKEQISVKVPAQYKNTKLLLSTNGTLSYEDNRIAYKPQGFKIGRLRLPVNMAMKKMSKISNEDIKVVNDKIYVTKTVIPFNFTSLKVENGKVIAYIEKFIPSGLFKAVKDPKASLTKLEEDLAKLSTLTTNEQEKEKINIAIEDVKTAVKNNNSSIETLDKVKNELIDIAEKVADEQTKKEIGAIKENVEKVKNEVENNEQASNSEQSSQNNNNAQASRQQALSKVYSQLSGAAGSLPTAQERAVIERMLSTIGMMQSNPSYNYGGDEGAVKAIYSKLTPEQRNRVKSAIYSSVDSKTIVELRNAFGI